MSLAIFTACLSSSITPRWPGTVETLALRRGLLDSILSPIAAIAPGFGPMKTMPAAASALRKRLALGQEAVAGMHGLSARPLAGLHDLVDHEITLGRLRRADRNRLVGHGDVQRIACRRRNKPQPS